MVKHCSGASEKAVLISEMIGNISGEQRERHEERRLGG